MAFALYARISPHSTTSYRMTGGHNSCPMPHSVPFRSVAPQVPRPQNFRMGSTVWDLGSSCCNYNWTPHATAASCAAVFVCACAPACVCVCVLNIAIYHANAFFNFNMPPGIIKTLQTHNMSQEPRAVEKRHGGKLSPQMMGYHRLHVAKICLIRSSDNILFQFTPASYRTYHIQFSL